MFVISGIYKKHYNQICKHIKRQAKNNQKRKDVLKDIHALFIDLEINQKPLDEFVDHKAYAKELLENLDIKPFRRLNRYILALFLVSIILASGTMLYLNEMSKYLALNQPVVSIHPNHNTLSWSTISNADYYDIYIDGVFVTSTEGTIYSIPNPGYSNTISVVIEAKSNNKYNLPTKSEPTLITTKNKQTTLYDISIYSVMTYFDQYGNAFVSTAVDFTGRYVINVYDAYAHDVEVIDKTTDEKITVDIEGNIKSVYLKKLHYYEFRIKQAIDESFVYFKLDAYETRTTLDQETFTLGPNSDILIRYDNPTDIRQYYRLTELNNTIMMNTYTGISHENRDVFNSNYGNTIRLREAQVTTYLVISNFADYEQTIKLESFTDDVIDLEVDTPIVLKDIDQTQIFTFDHYGRFEFTYTYGVKDFDMLFYDSNGNNILAYCNNNESDRTCYINFTGIAHVVFTKSMVQRNQVGISTLEVKVRQD